MRLSDRMKKTRDEISALKVVQPINGGSLTQRAVEAQWTGQIRSSAPISKYSLLAAFKATYTRTDGINKPPFVQFAFSLNPDSTWDSASGGMVFSFGENSVSYRICLFNTWWPWDQSTDVGTLNLICKAYSTVPGTLRIERVYS